MFLFDLKDHRKGSNYLVEVSEESVLAALEEAGVEFKTPLSVRFRIRDMDRRMIVVNSDLVDNLGDEWRLKIYVPPYGMDAENLPDMEQLRLVINAQLRHHFAHIVQARQKNGLSEKTPEEMEAYEAEAHMLALTGEQDVVQFIGLTTVT